MDEKIRKLSEFQFLIGRLATGLRNTKELDDYMFQFLIGRLATRKLGLSDTEEVGSFNSS